MAEFKILCPSCTSILSSKKPIPNGRRITCPHCHKPFMAATSEAGSSGSGSSLELDFTVPTPSSPTSTTKSAAPKASEHPCKVPAKKNPRRVGVWLAMIALVILAGGGGAAGMYYYMKTPDSPVVAKSKSAKSAEPKLAAANVVPVGSKEDQAAKTQPKIAAAKPEGEKVRVVKGDAPLLAAAGAAPPAAKAAKPAAKPAAWKEFKSAKGGFAVMFPGDPKEILEREEDVIFYEAKAESAGAEYEITFHRLKKDEIKLPVKDRLDAIAEQYKDAIQEKKEIELSGQPALELKLLLGEKKILAFQRWVVYKEHVFHISVLGDREKLGPDQVTRFLDSFRFVADPQGEFVDITRATNIPEKK